MRRHSGGFRMLSAMKPRRAHAFLVVLGLILSACSGQVVSETFGNVAPSCPSGPPPPRPDPPPPHSIWNW